MSRSIRRQSLVTCALATALFVSSGIAGAHTQGAQKVSLRLDWVD
jgi:hypothetical protein